MISEVNENGTYFVVAEEVLNKFIDVVIQLLTTQIIYDGISTL
jgi:hypothetical protein